MKRYEYDLIKNQYQDYYHKVPSLTTGGVLSASIRSSEASSKVASMDGSKSSESSGKLTDKKTKICQQVAAKKNKKVKKAKKIIPCEDSGTTPESIGSSSDVAIGSVTASSRPEPQASPNHYLLQKERKQRIKTKISP